jgi:hypothetical protein
MWCSTGDVDRLIGNLPVGSGVDKASFLTKSEAIMNSMFAGIYDLPITIPSTYDAVASGVTTNLLQSIQEDLTAGIFLLAQSSVHEADSLHQYAKDLESRALKQLQLIHDGKMTLIGVTTESDLTSTLINPAKILSRSPEDYDTAFPANDLALDSQSFFNGPIDRDRRLL